MTLEDLVKDFRSKVADMVINDEEPITTELLNKIDSDFIEALTQWADEQRAELLEEIHHLRSTLTPAEFHLELDYMLNKTLTGGEQSNADQ